MLNGGILTRIRMKMRLVSMIYRDLTQLQFNQKRYILEQNILHCTAPGITGEHYCGHDIIVSLTTHGRRINDVHLAIESIMGQTVMANRIVLWLGRDMEGRCLPRALQLQQKRGLEVRYCDDMRSYTKLIPALKAFPDAAIITVDDDMVYDFDVLEHLITAYMEDQSYIYCCRQHRMLPDKDNRLLPYAMWQKECPVTGEADVMNFPTGCGGVLYPPGSLDDEVFNETVFMDICRYADDVWFKAMALKKGTLSMKVHTRDLSGNDCLENNRVQDIGLKRINIGGDSLNDKQIKAVFGRYGLYELLV